MSETKWAQVGDLWVAMSDRPLTNVILVYPGPRMMGYGTPGVWLQYWLTPPVLPRRLK